MNKERFNHRSDFDLVQYISLIVHVCLRNITQFVFAFADTCSFQVYMKHHLFLGDTQSLLKTLRKRFKKLSLNLKNLAQVFSTYNRSRAESMITLRLNSIRLKPRPPQ